MVECIGGPCLFAQLLSRVTFQLRTLLLLCKLSVFAFEGLYLGQKGLDLLLQVSPLFSLVFYYLLFIINFGLMLLFYNLFLLLELGLQVSLAAAFQ